MSTKEGDVYLCDFCGAEFVTRSGATRHEKKCEYRVDEERKDDRERSEPAPSKEKKVEETAVELFPEPKARERPAVRDAEPEGDEYCCPTCGYTQGRPYRTCPECGEELEWPESG